MMVFGTKRVFSVILAILFSSMPILGFIGNDWVFLPVLFMFCAFLADTNMRLAMKNVTLSIFRRDGFDISYPVLKFTVFLIAAISYIMIASIFLAPPHKVAAIAFFTAKTLTLIIIGFLVVYTMRNSCSMKTNFFVKMTAVFMAIILNLFVLFAVYANFFIRHFPALEQIEQANIIRCIFVAFMLAIPAFSYLYIFLPKKSFAIWFAVLIVTPLLFMSFVNKLPATAFIVILFSCLFAVFVRINKVVTMSTVAAAITVLFFLPYASYSYEIFDSLVHSISVCSAGLKGLDITELFIGKGVMSHMNFESTASSASSIASASGVTVPLANMERINIIVPCSNIVSFNAIAECGILGTTLIFIISMSTLRIIAHRRPVLHDKQSVDSIQNVKFVFAAKICVFLVFFLAINTHFVFYDPEIINAAFLSAFMFSLIELKGFRASLQSKISDNL